MDNTKNENDEWRYAEPHSPISYEPFRQTYELPKWKDTKGRHKKGVPEGYLLLPRSNGAGMDEALVKSVASCRAFV